MSGNWMLGLGKPKAPRARSDRQTRSLPDAEIAAAYAAGDVVREIASRYGCSESRVIVIARRYGVPLRGIGNNPLARYLPGDPVPPKTWETSGAVRWDIDACIARLARQIADDERRGGSAFG